MLVENYTQYPALTGLNPGMRQFLKASTEAVTGVRIWKLVADKDNDDIGSKSSSVRTPRGLHSTELV